MKSVQRIVNTAHWANIAGIGAQVLQIVPQKPWVMALQALLAAFLPSLHGVGHAVAFGQPQVRKD